MENERASGYRDLSESETAMVNDAKRKADDIGKLIDVLADQKLADPRWLAIAKTDLQKGFMSLIRAITKPEFF